MRSGRYLKPCSHGDCDHGLTPCGITDGRGAPALLSRRSRLCGQLRLARSLAGRWGWLQAWLPRAGRVPCASLRDLCVSRNSPRASKHAMPAQSPCNVRLQRHHASANSGGSAANVPAASGGGAAAPAATSAVGSQAAAASAVDGTALSSARPTRPVHSDAEAAAAAGGGAPAEADPLAAPDSGAAPAVKAEATPRRRRRNQGADGRRRRQHRTCGSRPEAPCPRAEGRWRRQGRSR